MKIRSCLLAAALAAQFSPALAADYDPPIVVDDAPEYQPVEVGSGWYLRGDLGYNFDSNYRNDVDPTSFDYEDTPLGASVGMGFHFNDYLRAEFDLGALGGDRFSNDIASTCDGNETETVNTTNTVLVPDGNGGFTPITVTDSTTNTTRSSRDCPGKNEGSNNAYQLMAKGYVDLGTYAGLTPYVGGGVGIAYTKYSSELNRRTCSAEQTTVAVPGSTTTTTFLCDGQSTINDDPIDYSGIEDSQKRFGLAYAINAGFAYRLGRNTSLDVGYEYLAMPGARYVVSDGVAHTVHEDITSQQIKVGLRYDLW